MKPKSQFLPFSPQKISVTLKKKNDLTYGGGERLRQKRRNMKPYETTIMVPPYSHRPTWGFFQGPSIYNPTRIQNLVRSQQAGL